MIGKYLIGLVFLLALTYAAEMTNSDINATELIINLEEEVRQQWESTTRQRPSALIGKEPENNIPPMVLITWFPWFEITTDAPKKSQPASSTQYISRLLPIRGVGTWREITLSGRNKEISRNEIPGSSALCVNSAVLLSAEFFIVIIMCIFLQCCIL